MEIEQTVIAAISERRANFEMRLTASVERCCSDARFVCMCRLKLMPAIQTQVVFAGSDQNRGDDRSRARIQRWTSNECQYRGTRKA
jgi:hypothetical protein